MEFFQAILMLIGLFVVISWLGTIFRAYTILFIIATWAIPLITCVFIREKSIYQRIPLVSFKRMRTTLIVLSVTGSMCVFFHYDSIRDWFGENNIKGYEASYYPTSDQYGRADYDVNIKTNHLSGRFILWALEWIAVITIFGIPYIVWKAFEPIVEEKEQESPGCNSPPSGDKYTKDDDIPLF